MLVLTGGAGFIGSAFLWKLNQKGITDVLVVDEMDSSEKWRNLTGKKFYDYVEKDDFLNMIGSNGMPVPRKVVHMGACSDTTCTDAKYFIKNNFEYSKELFLWAQKNKASFLYASSAATYGDGGVSYSDSEDNLDNLLPLNMYAFSKQLFDLWLRRRNLFKKAIGIKFFNVFGPNEYHKKDMSSVICKLFPQVRDEGKIRLFRSYRQDYENGEQKRDFVYIKDAVEVMYYFLCHPEKTGIYNLGTGKARSWNDLAKAMFKSLGKKPDIAYIDMPRELIDKYQYYTQADISKLRNTGCEHNFMNLEESVDDYINNFLMDVKVL